jgi:hypothetical protein
MVMIPDGKGELVSDIDAVVRSFAADRRSFGYFLDGTFDDETLVNGITRLKYPMAGGPLKISLERQMELECECVTFRVIIHA